MTNTARTHIHLAYNNDCTGCAACASVCPTKCITMVEDCEGFLQPRINKSECIKCHKCEKTCPIINPQHETISKRTKAFAVINRNEQVRMASSSGGVFHALADYVIRNGGVVFGAIFDKDFMGVHHDYTEFPEGIEPMMRSKYVQSRTEESFLKCRDFLNQGRLVLYSGTP